MDNYQTIIASVVAGIFALASGWLAWKLKSVTDHRQEENKNQKDKEALYREVFECFEMAIRGVKRRDITNIEERFLKLNSKVNLHAPEEILEKYSEVSVALEEWSVLFLKASPKTVDAGGIKMTLVQAPDPAEKYKEAEKKAFENLQCQFRSLTLLMKSDINST